MQLKQVDHGNPFKLIYVYAIVYLIEKYHFNVDSCVNVENALSHYHVTSGHTYTLKFNNSLKLFIVPYNKVYELI